MIRKKIIIVALLGIFTSCAAQKKEKISGDRDVISVTHQIDQPFNGISVGNDFEVKIKQSQRNSYILTADKNLVDIVTFKVKDSILHIETTQRITSSKRLEIYLNVDKIDKIELKNEVELKSDGPLESNNMVISGYDDSNFELDLTVEKLGMNLQGKSSGEIAGNAKNFDVFMNDRSELEAELETEIVTINLQKRADLDLEGTAEDATINMAGNSRLKAREFEIENSEITLIDKAEADLQVEETLTIYAKDKSVLNSYGKAELKTTLSGDVTLNKKS
ncbi:MAG: DUF2807 domain-containing protein [Leeuwenhoekiella sp.]